MFLNVGGKIKFHIMCGGIDEVPAHFSIHFGFYHKPRHFGYTAVRRNAHYGALKQNSYKSAKIIY